MDHSNPGLLVKLAPNQDLTEALRTACGAAGLARARVRGAVGSLVEAVLARAGDDAIVQIDGPALEIAALSGEVRVDAPDTGEALHAFVCTARGEVAEGRLLPGRNPIAVTFEVVLEAVAAIEAPVRRG